ncbi:MAG TPA: lipoyl(octanoyl) transferase LipB [Solirubrobacterales bacterium]|nr:lipoyl(octanoyl) transferase LipB [Solirubrobacterales bacterium]
MSDPILVARLGTVPYEEAREIQRRLAVRRQAAEIPDVLLLLEHPPVYTRGRRSLPEELPMGVEWYEAQGIEVLDTDRGGLVTYHGPGQLVAYPIVSLAPYGGDVHEYVRRLERVTIETLARLGVEATVHEGLTGVWTLGTPPALPREALGPPLADPARKIASIGIHVSRGVTTHGLAINVNNDLQPFEWVVPCGIGGVAMTSVARELGAERDLAGLGDVLAERFGAICERTPVDTPAAELGLSPAAATLTSTA